MNLSTELTDVLVNESSDSSSIISTTVFIAFGLCGVIDNGIVLLVIAIVKDLQNATNLLIANQSLIDLVTSAFLLTLTVVPTSLPVARPYLARFMCAFWLTWYPFWMCVTASSINLVIITFERFYAISYPMRYRRNMNRRRVAILSIIPWVYGIFFNAFFFAWTRVDGHICLTFLWPSADIKKAIGVFIFSLQFLGLICIITILYIFIALNLWRGLMRGQSDDVNLVRERARRNVLETLLMVFVCYVICWAPNDIYSLNYYLKEDIEFEGIIYDITVLMAFANAWINPLIYSFRYARFQKALKMLICCKIMRPERSHVSTISQAKM